MQGKRNVFISIIIYEYFQLYSLRYENLDRSFKQMLEMSLLKNRRKQEHVKNLSE